MAFFSLAIKILEIPEDLSKNQKRNIRGRRSDIECVPVFLIGQLGRSDRYNSKYVIANCQRGGFRKRMS